jgi:hypothetical protein
VAGIFDRKGFIDTPYVMSLAAHDKLAGGRLDTKALILLDEGADQAAVQAALTTALAGYPDAKVLDGPAYEKEAAGFVDQLLGFVTVMLLLAVVIALLGIVNTLALSVFERTRELGLLAAVGMTGAQVRSMVRYEAAVIALIGSGAGAVLGIGLGVAMTKALEDQGMGTIAVPGAADRRVRRPRCAGRRPRGHRTGSPGGQGRRPAGGGHRLTDDRLSRKRRTGWQLPPGPSARHGSRGSQVLADERHRGQPPHHRHPHRCPREVRGRQRRDAEEREGPAVRPAERDERRRVLERVHRAAPQAVGGQQHPGHRADARDGLVVRGTPRCLRRRPPPTSCRRARPRRRRRPSGRWPSTAGRRG